MSRSINKSIKISSIDSDSIEKSQESKEWIIIDEIPSSKCRFRFRKWRPVSYGWYCRLTGDLCLKEKCKKRK